jgi:hypothetical protein
MRSKENAAGRKRREEEELRGQEDRKIFILGIV